MLINLQADLKVVDDRGQTSLETRHSLLDRLKNWGDETSWREFFETYWQLIYNVARAAGLDHSEAQEVVQETIIGVAKRIGQFQTGPQYGSFKSWLLRQTRWRIADQFRRRPCWASSNGSEQSPRAPAEDSDATAAIHQIPDPGSLELDQAWELEWERHVMRTALERVKARVSVKQFQLFDLHACQGLAAGVVAKTLGVSVASVYMARTRVARLLKAETKALRQSDPGTD